MSDIKPSYYHPIVGRKDTGVHDRLPIHDLQKKPEQFALFIVAFLKIQGRVDSLPELRNVIDNITVPQGALYEDIAGIHGRPFNQWPGDTQKNLGDFDRDDPKDIGPIPSRFGGYCSHGAVIFPCWHRPYMLLIEQAIGDVAEKIAQTWEKAYPATKGTWISAAKELRFPFWDWADKRVEKEGVPEVLCSEKVNIKVPWKENETVTNPLAYLPLSKIPQDFLDQPENNAYYTQWLRTHRYADSKSHDASSDLEKLQEKVKKQAEGLRSQVALLFTASGTADPAQTWDEFSNHTTQSLRATDFYNVGSLEGVHNTVHGLVGGNGHMADPDYAAFDPIFFFHHCNVDRLYALWEYCYPDFWMGEGYSPEKGRRKIPWYQAAGSYIQVYNAQLLPTTGLAPFRTAEGKYWTSDDVRFLDGKGIPKYYSYPEVNGVKVDKPATAQERLKARLALQQHFGLDPRTENTELKFHNNPIFNRKPVYHQLLPGYRHFIVVVQLREHALNGSYSFKLYHDDKPDDDIKPVLVNSVDVFARVDTSNCQGCSVRRNAGTVVRGVISLRARDVNSILALHPAVDDPKKSQEELAEHMKKAFTAILENPEGDKLAGAGSQIADVGLTGDLVPMSENLAPVGVTLLSSAASFAEIGNEDEGPAHFVEWVNHGAVFKNNHKDWKMTKAAASV